MNFCVRFFYSCSPPLLYLLLLLRKSVFWSVEIVMSTNNNVGLNGKGVGVPVKLMHESEGHVVTVRNREEESLRLSILLSRNVFLSSFFFVRSLFLMRERELETIWEKSICINDAR